LNDSGQLGDGTTSSRSVPTRVSEQSFWQTSALRDTHGCGVREGQLYCWGSNTHGELGNGWHFAPQPVSQ
jgi:alpha-tubulin suppressor-like RCC1 family protein